MFWKRRPLQSKSEIWLRNISMGFLVLYLGLFMVIPMIMAAVGSLHQWNPLNETWRWLGIENYIRMFSYPTFWQSMINTVVFCVVVVFFRVLLLKGDIGHSQTRAGRLSTVVVRAAGQRAGAAVFLVQRGSLLGRIWGRGVPHPILWEGPGGGPWRQARVGDLSRRFKKKNALFCCGKNQDRFARFNFSGSGISARPLPIG